MAVQSVNFFTTVTFFCTSCKHIPHALHNVCCSMCVYRLQLNRQKNPLFLST